MTLSDATDCYQTLLEGHRAYPDNDELFEDLLKARAAMEVAWLERMADEPFPA
jgi:hypothetical protein